MSILGYSYPDVFPKPSRSAVHGAEPTPIPKRAFPWVWTRSIGCLLLQHCKILTFFTTYITSCYNLVIRPNVDNTWLFVLVNHLCFLYRIDFTWSKWLRIWWVNSPEWIHLLFESHHTWHVSCTMWLLLMVMIIDLFSGFRLWDTSNYRGHHWCDLVCVGYPNSS